MEEYTAQTRKRSWKKIVLSCLGLLLLAAIIGAGYYGATIDLDSAKEEAQEVYITPQTEPVTLAVGGPVTTPTPTPAEATPTPATPTPTPTPTSSPTPSPTPTPAPATTTSTKEYTNKSLRFSIQVPHNWSISATNGQVIVTTSEKHLYNIQMYAAAGSAADTLKTYLASQSNIHNVRSVTLFGNPGYEFDMDGRYTRGYAFLNNGRLYYLLGEGVLESAVGLTFKTL
ncbi:MAG: hypothetical protein KBD66_02730 [Candidatus Doudnabacteria bacterium]|nr:hypothetical protein [Candidatus Doudnabacteria bacterium]